MQPLYPERTVFENLPSKNTPVNDVNLNKLDYAVHGIDKRVLELYGYQDRVAESEKNAKVSEENALQYANDSQSSANSAKESENNALTYKNEASTSAVSAEQSNQESKQNADESATSAEQSANSEANALLYYKNAQSYANQINDRIDEATESANLSKEYSEIALSQANISSTNANQSENYALMSESYAHGGTGTRDNEDVDNAEYYYQQSKAISESFAGALLPMGTVSFENLPDIDDAIAGWMYNISNSFTTNSHFKEGIGYTIPAGANVYKTGDGYWDVLAGSPVTGVKGNAESSYRKGNVNITPKNIGLGNVPNVATNNQTPTYTVATATTGMVSGEELSVAFGKIAKVVNTFISKAISNLTAKGPLGYNASTASNLIPTISTLAFWNGAYVNTSSNLSYCVKGAFGDASTKGVDTTVTSDSPNLVTSGAVRKELDTINTNLAKTNEAVSELNSDLSKNYELVLTGVAEQWVVVDVGNYKDIHIVWLSDTGTILDNTSIPLDILNLGLNSVQWATPIYFNGTLVGQWCYVRNNNIGVYLYDNHQARVYAK